MAPKIRYDRENCEGFFICVAADPDTWKEADDDKADLEGGEKKGQVWEKEISEDELDDAEAAADGCPVDVIQVVDDDGNVVSGPDKLPVEE